MKTMRTTMLLLAGFLASGNALANGVKPEKAIEYRQGVFGAMGWQMGAMLPMVKGEKAFDKAEFAKLSGRLAALSEMPWEGFVPGSDKGNSKAKPELWKEMDKVIAGADKFQAESKKLADLAKGGDEKAIKAQFAEVGKTCKACHDNYKNK